MLDARNMNKLQLLLPGHQRFGHSARGLLHSLSYRVVIELYLGGELPNEAPIEKWRTNTV
jgi:hypothetical protein